MLFTHTQNKFSLPDTFEAETNFKQGEGSIFICLSLGILETLIRFIGYKSISMPIKNKIEDDLNSLANTSKKKQVNIELLDAFKNLFKIVSEVPDPKTGFILLRDMTGNEQIFKSFEMIMKSLIVLITPNQLDLHCQLNTVNIPDVKHRILETIAKHYGIYIKLFQGRYNIFDINPKTTGYGPILYIYNFQDNYKILYTKEAIDIESGSADLSIFQSPNIFYRSESYETLDIIDLSLNEHFNFSESKKIKPSFPIFGEMPKNIFNFRNYSENEHASLYLRPTNSDNSARTYMSTNLAALSYQHPKKNLEIMKDLRGREEKLYPTTANKINSKAHRISTKKLPALKNLNQDLLNLQLRPVVIKNSKPTIQKESKRNMFSTYHINFYIEVKKGKWNDINIVIKRYKKLKKFDWRPEQFFKEIQILQMCSKLAESGLPFLRCHGAYLEKKSLTILLESYESELKIRIETLKSLDKQFTEVELKKIVLRLLEGFLMLERLGIKHLNINPSTILIIGSGEKIDVRITDINYSDSKSSGSSYCQNHQIIMSEIYKAPELFEKDENMRILKTADVYSLGLVFFQLSDVNINIHEKNSKKNQNNLKNEIRYVKYDWLRNLLDKMLDDVETRINFEALKKLLLIKG